MASQKKKKKNQDSRKWKTANKQDSKTVKPPSPLQKKIKICETHILRKTIRHLNMMQESFLNSLYMVKQRVCVHSEFQLYFQNYRGKMHSKRALFSLIFR